MKKDRKESRQFNISVEGINCERMYFEHLSKLINQSNRNRYNVKINSRKISPEQFAKRNAHRPIEKNKGRTIPYFHIQDIEDYYDDGQRKKFYHLIDEIRKVEREYGISYKLGYTNFTFELWMLLHVADMESSVIDRNAYLKIINQKFCKNYLSLDNFKSEQEFSKILTEFITLETVIAAIKRSEKIVETNGNIRKTHENYKGFLFYRDNPDLTIHEIVKFILDICGIKYSN